MIRPAIAIVILLALLVLLPYVWPQGFGEPPLLMVALLAVAAVVAALVGRRRQRGWGTSSSN
jgi:peptidoglycan/LPS O-acetylase OafA/YrhL